jgi:hypothetical protein
MIESRRVPRRPLTIAAPLAARRRRVDAEPAALAEAKVTVGDLRQPRSRAGTKRRRRFCRLEAALMRVLFVVPAFNEERALPAVIGELRSEATALALDADVLIVDDGSGDRTSEVAASSGARVLRLCRNLGIGGAVQVGLRLALREGFDCAKSTATASIRRPSCASS